MKPTPPLLHPAPPVLLLPLDSRGVEESKVPDKPDSPRQLALGLIFGVVFGCCPGTGAAALGQGNFDVIAGIIGLMAGSYLFAETSGRVAGTIDKIGNRGKIMLPDLIGMRLTVFLGLFIPLLGVVLLGLDRLAD
jgi:uncharacterized protein